MALQQAVANRIPRQKFSEKSVEVFLRLVPNVSSAAQATHRFFAIFLSAIAGAGLLVLLIINILLAQDAFTLSELKLEAKLVADQREAIDRQIDQVSSPAALAKTATDLGMQASQSPIFLNLATEAQSRPSQERPVG